MSEAAQIYLATPAAFEPEVFAPRLAAVLDRWQIACVRLELAGADEAAVIRAADALREVAHARDVPLVLRDHVLLAARLGLDGVHLSDGGRNVRTARGHLGRDAIVGAFCGASRHAGLTAAEAGADYVAFGPAGASALGDGTRAEADLFAWWAEMIEVPVVAEGALDAELAATLGGQADFLCLGAEVWTAEDADAALTAFRAQRK